MAVPPRFLAAIGVIGLIAACGSPGSGTTPSVVASPSLTPAAVETTEPTDSALSSASPNLSPRAVGPGDASCVVDLAISGAVTFEERGTFRAIMTDAREPDSWSLFLQPHVAQAVVEGKEVDITHTIQVIEFDGDGPDTPLVVWRWYVVPPPPTPPPAPPSGVGLVETPHVTFFHYQWLATAPSDRTLPPGVSLAPAIGHAAFDGPTSATFDVTFNIPEPAADAPKGDISAAGTIDCESD